MIRAPAFTQGGFVSHDVAGILYSAMVFVDGGLPYVNTVELKAPGCFYLAWVFAGAEGRDIASFQIVANLWAMVGTCLVFGMMARARGLLAATVAGGVYVLQQPWLDSMDANYVIWANTFQVGAVAAVWRGPDRRMSARAADWILAGLLVGGAALCKRQAAFLMLPLLWSAMAVGGRDDRRLRLWSRAALGLAGGAALPFAAVFAHYAASGNAGAFVRGYAFNDWGWSYVAAVDVGAWVLAETVMATTFFLALPLGLLCAAGVHGVRGTHGAREAVRRWGLVLGWLAATLLAAWIGGRLYKGYFALTMAPAAMLAGGAVASLARASRIDTRSRPGSRALRWAMAVAVAVLTARSGLLLIQLRGARDVPRDAGGRRLAAHIEAHTAPDDTIWVWGWHLWDLYPLSGRMAGSSIYKSLGVLTPPNDDSWRRGPSPLHFVDSSRADLLLRELRASRPRYIVLGSTVPHPEFQALRDYLATSYALDRRVRVGHVQMWRLRAPPPTP
jgi:hypothetical protein